MVLSSLRGPLTGNHQVFNGQLVFPNLDLPSWRNADGRRFADRHSEKIQARRKAILEELVKAGITDS
jgi:hypothetical protein